MSKKKDVLIGWVLMSIPRNKISWEDDEIDMVIARDKHSLVEGTDKTWKAVKVRMVRI